MILFAFAQKNNLPNAKRLPAYVLEQKDNALFSTRQKSYALLWQLAEQLPDAGKKIFAENFFNIEKDPLGRPRFSHPQIDFNLSHSGDFVAAILFFDENKKGKIKIAIDIEHHNNEKNFSSLLKRFASDEEIAWAKGKPQKFYELWCIREALLKASGTGLRKLRQVKCDPIQKKIYSPDNLEGDIYFFNQKNLSLAFCVGKTSAPTFEKILQVSQNALNDFQSQRVYQVTPKKDLDFD